MVDEVGVGDWLRQMSREIEKQSVILATVSSEVGQIRERLAVMETLAAAREPEWDRVRAELDQTRSDVQSLAVKIAIAGAGSGALLQFLLKVAQ